MPRVVQGRVVGLGTEGEGALKIAGGKGHSQLTKRRIVKRKGCRVLGY